MEYLSYKIVESSLFPGVRFKIRRISLQRRIQLLEAIGELLKRLEFHAAGREEEDQVAAARASAEVERIYLLWGLEGIEGLKVDGEAATPEKLLEHGPEALVREIVEAIRAECTLTEAERKN